MLLKFAVVVMVVAACSKPADKSNAVGSATAPPVASGGGCEKIPLADFQALLTDKITSVTGSTVGACNAYVGKELGLAVVLDPGPEFDAASPGAHVLTGIGDKAYWHAGDIGINGPTLHALKGKTVCEVASPAPAHDADDHTSGKRIRRKRCRCGSVHEARWHVVQRHVRSEVTRHLARIACGVR